MWSTSLPFNGKNLASIIGRIIKKQMKELTGKLPTVFAVTGGGSDLSAINYPYYNEKCRYFWY